MPKYLQVGLFENPGWIFLNVLVLWAQDGNATRLLTNTQVSADRRARLTSRLQQFCPARSSS